MKRTWVIPAIMVAGLAGLGSAAYASSAQDGWRGGLAPMIEEGAADYNWSAQRWRDDDRRDDDRRGDGPREGRRGDDDNDCGPRGRGGHGWGHHGRGYGRDHGHGPREGRGYDRRDDSDRGYGRGSRHGRHGGMGRGGPGGFDAAELDSVKRELNITAQQDAAWTKYAGAVKEAADAMKARREAMRAGAARNLSVEDHRKFRDSMMEQRRKEIDAVRTAADELVKLLDEKQVAIAKEVLPGYAFGPGMRMGMGGMGMGGTGIGGMGMGGGRDR